MRLPPTFLLLLSSFVFLFFLTHQSVAEAEEPENYLAGGIGLEQLTYKEQIPDIDLTSSDTETTNLVLFLEGRKTLQRFYLGVQANIPLSPDEGREYWTKGGEFEQVNFLKYRWTRIDAYVGYLLHSLLNPYIGLEWSYSEQKRSGFEVAETPGILSGTATEEANSVLALFGVEGKLPIAARWSLSYSAKYMLPFHSTITNDNLAGWEASDIKGYSYTLTARLHYMFNKTVSAALQVFGGRQHWEGSAWIPVGDSRARWPENDTDFIAGLISIYRYF